MKKIVTLLLFTSSFFFAHGSQGKSDYTKVLEVLTEALFELTFQEPIDQDHFLNRVLIQAQIPDKSRPMFKNMLSNTIEYYSINNKYDVIMILKKILSSPSDTISDDFKKRIEEKIESLDPDEEIRQTNKTDYEKFNDRIIDNLLSLEFPNTMTLDEFIDQIIAQERPKDQSGYRRAVTNILKMDQMHGPYQPNNPEHISQILTKLRQENIESLSRARKAAIAKKLDDLLTAPAHTTVPAPTQLVSPAAAMAPAEEKTCPLCFENFVNNRRVLHKFGDVEHAFCQKCLTRWTQSGHENARTCPLCRKVFTQEQINTALTTVPAPRQQAAPAVAMAPAEPARGLRPIPALLHRRPEAAFAAAPQQPAARPAAAAAMEEQHDPNCELCNGPIDGDQFFLHRNRNGNSHTFHKACINGFFELFQYTDTPTNCPLCNEPFSEEEVRRVYRNFPMPIPVGIRDYLAIAPGIPAEPARRLQPVPAPRERRPEAAFAAAAINDDDDDIAQAIALSLQDLTEEQRLQAEEERQFQEILARSQLDQ